MMRPGPGDCAPYYFVYIDKVPEGEVLVTLEAEAVATSSLLRGLSETEAAFSYAPGKWTIKDVLAHVIDTERVFVHRALSFARRDPTPLPDMDQDVWAASSGADQRTLAALLEELRFVRASTVALFRGFDADMWERSGVASGVEFRVRSFPWILAGHERHHRCMIEERYLTAM